MATLDCNFNGSEVEAPPWFVTRHPAVFIALVYVVMVAFAVLFMQGLGAAQNNPSDSRNLSAAVILAILLAPSFIWALRRPRLPGHPQR